VCEKTGLSQVFEEEKASIARVDIWGRRGMGVVVGVGGKENELRSALLDAGDIKKV